MLPQPAVPDTQFSVVKDVYKRQDLVWLLLYHTRGEDRKEQHKNQDTCAGSFPDQPVACLFDPFPHADSLLSTFLPLGRSWIGFAPFLQALLVLHRRNPQHLFKRAAEILLAGVPDRLRNLIHLVVVIAQKLKRDV